MPEDVYQGYPPHLFDEQRAASLVGKYILVGLTHVDHLGNETGRWQMHGVIETASPRGVGVSLRGVYEGQPCVLPPDLTGIYPANPGTYRLKSTGETVVDPDYVASLTRTAPAPSSGAEDSRSLPRSPDES